MKFKLFTISFIIFSLHTDAQTICGTVDENQTLTLTAPVGYSFTSVTFASYGTPNGTCGSFTIGGCNASNSVSIVEAALIGNNSASIDATNTVFGDPCGGTFKRLYVEAVYSKTLPLTIISFSGSVQNNFNVLKWETADEENTLEFDIERSADGSQFSKIGVTAAANSSGNRYYFFVDSTSGNGNFFYRLKMVDIDGKYTYSKVIRLSNSSLNELVIFPNPAKNTITVSGLQRNGIIDIINMDGKILHHINVTSFMQSINIANYPHGVLLLKYTNDHETVLQKIIKQ